MAANKKANKKSMTMRQRRTLEGIMFITPWIIGAALFFVYPLITSIRMSFSTMDSLAGLQMKWAGLENYKYLLFTSTTYVPRFLEQVKNTLMNTPIILVFSLIIAMLVNKDIKGRGFFRTVFFLPVLLGTGFVMEQLLSTGMDSVVSVPDSILLAIGPTFAELVSGILVRITTVLWKSGVQIILFLAGLQGIPGSLYEASRCDGATEWENFWKITLPIVSPIILLNFIYTMIDSFTDSGNEIITEIVKCFLDQGNLTRGAAMGWFYFLFTFIVCILALGIMSKLTYNIGER